MSRLKAAFVGGPREIGRTVAREFRQAALAVEHSTALKNSPKTRAVLFRLPAYLVALTRLTFASNRCDWLASAYVGGTIAQADRHFERVDAASDTWKIAFVSSQNALKAFDAIRVKP